MEELEAIVTGRVTGVMFRDFIARRARRLDLTGWVQNLPNRSVKVVAQGKRQDLETLIQYLRRGSLLSRVDNVGVTWKQATNNDLPPFRICF